MVDRERYLTEILKQALDKLRIDIGTCTVVARIMRTPDRSENIHHFLPPKHDLIS